MSDPVIYQLALLLPNLRYLDLSEVSGIKDLSTLSIATLKHLRFLRCTSINTTPYIVQLIVKVPKFLDLEELDIRGIPVSTETFKKLIGMFKALSVVKVTFLHSMSDNKLVAALNPRRSGNPNSLELLCVCDDREDVSVKVIETLQSFHLCAYKDRQVNHSYCSAELEILTINEPIM